MRFRPCGTIESSFTRYLAKSIRIPEWAVSSLPPAGLITTPAAAIQVANMRRQHAIQVMNLAASLLNNKAAAHHISVETNFEGLKKQYAIHLPVTGTMDTFSLPTAIQLAQTLVERETSTMNAKFHAESDNLKLAPEASLWKGIPTHLIAPNVAGLTDLNANTGHPNNQAQTTRNTHPSALFTEAMHFMQREKDSTIHVSPLPQATPGVGLLMTAPWGPPPQRHQRQNKQNQQRRGPYRPPPAEMSRIPQEGFQRRQDRNRQGRQANFQQQANHQQEDSPYPLSPRERNFLQQILEKSRY